MKIPSFKLFASLKQRAFALLWSGQAISRLGDAIYRIALSWWVLEETSSAAMMGTVLIVSFTPMLLFLLIGGVAVDRFSRTRLMFASDLLRGLVVLVVAYLAHMHVLQVWHILAASVVFGFVEAFFQPAYSALVPVIIPSDSLPSANSLNSLSIRIAGIIGPAVGASLISAGGPSFAFLLDGLSFLVSAVCLLPLMVSVKEAHAKPAAHQNVLHDFRDGFKTVFAIPWLWITIAVFALGNIFLSGPMAISLPFYVKDVLQQEVNVLGWLFSASSLGALLGVLYLGNFTRIRHRGPMMYAAFFLTGLVFVGIGMFHLTLPGLVFMFINGLTMAVFDVVWVNLLQEKIPNQKLGRVSSIDMLGSFALLPIGYGITGWVTDLIGSAPVFVVGGALSMLLAGLSLLHPQIRKLD